MPRKSLRPHLNQIRAWVRQGRTDAWVAHQLEVSVRDIEQFKRQNELVSDEEPAESASAPDYPEEIDLRAEDDALIAAELEAAEVEAERARRPRPRRRPSDEDGASRTRTSDAPRRARVAGAAGARRGSALGRAQRRPARGHLRPRRGGLRPVARPRHPGQPDLRRALGRASSGRGRRRRGPDRHPPHRRGRLRAPPGRG